MQQFDFIFLHPPRTFMKPWLKTKRKVLGLLSPKRLRSVPSQYALVPMGLFSLASSLIQEGYTAKIVNLAINQDLDPTFNMATYIKSLQSEVFAIDMHWFTQTASALELAYLLKKHNPNSLIVLGGLTATHFHKQIIERYPFVDAVLLGEADRSITRLAEAHFHHKELGEVKGIMYRDEKTIKYVVQEPPSNLDDFEFTQLELLENYRSYLKMDVIGYSDLLSNRIWLNIARGCPYNCIHCGGGKEAYYHFSLRENPLFRSPKRVADDIEKLSEYGIQGVCLSHDPEIFGEKYWSNLFKEIRRRAVEVHTYIESFRLPSKEFVKGLRQTFSSTLISLSPETVSEDIREFIGRGFSNNELFKSIENIREEGLNVNVYFAIGLPGETSGLLKEYEGFVDKLFSLGAMVIPPFPYTIDPNCLMALHPKKYGVRLLLKDVDDYKRICSSSNPRDWIGHETISSKKDDIFTLQSTINKYVTNLYQTHSSH